MLLFGYVILDKNSMSGTNIYPYIMNENENNDIDSESDLINSEKKLLI